MGRPSLLGNLILVFFVTLSAELAIAGELARCMKKVSDRLSFFLEAYKTNGDRDGKNLCHEVAEGLDHIMECEELPSSGAAVSTHRSLPLFVTYPRNTRDPEGKSHTLQLGGEALAARLKFVKRLADPPDRDSEALAERPERHDAYHDQAIVLQRLLDCVRSREGGTERLPPVQQATR